MKRALLICSAVVVLCVQLRAIPIASQRSPKAESAQAAGRNRRFTANQSGAPARRSDHPIEQQFAAAPRHGTAPLQQPNSAMQGLKPTQRSPKLNAWPPNSALQPLNSGAPPPNSATLPSPVPQPETPKSYAVVSGGTGGVGAALLALLRARGEVPLLLCRAGSVLPVGAAASAGTVTGSKTPETSSKTSSTAPAAALHLVIDYNDLTSLETAFPAFLSRHGIAFSDIHALYSLHGCGCFCCFDETGALECEEFLNANLKSHVQLALYFAQQCANLSRVAVVSSLCAVFPAQFFQLYGASKAFLEGFFIGFAQQYKQIATVVARPAAISNTRFMQQRGMARAGVLGRIVNNNYLSVDSSAVARVLANNQSGVYAVGWLARSFGAVQAAIGRQGTLRAVEALKLGRFLSRGRAE